MTARRCLISVSVCAVVSILAWPAFADCSTLPSWQSLRDQLQKVVALGPTVNGGLGFNMWGTLVDTDGTVCAVAFSGSKYGNQWLGSRVISAQKANTANGFSLGLNDTPSTSLFGTKGLALSTANLFTAVQPGGSLYGLQHSNPVETDVAYGNGPGNSGPSNASNFGTTRDPMVAQRVGGVNVFGGGLALYIGGNKVGALGVSGDTSCTDHMVAWRVRNGLKLDSFNGVPGVSGDQQRPDNIVFDIHPNGFQATPPDTPQGVQSDSDGGTGQNPTGNGGVGQSLSGWGHPKCGNNPNPALLPAVQ